MSTGARSRRFKSRFDPEAAELNASIGFDWRLLEHDVAASIAHVQMLARQGVLSVADAEQISDGLRTVQGKFERGEIQWDPALEDVHMNVEARLAEHIGDAGRRLHTGRSRNDQVATDLRLYTRAEATKTVAELDALRRVLVDQAEAHIDVFIPGYTHLQRAQPVRLAHHLMAYEAMFRRDRERIVDASNRAGESPLGSGALAGTTFPLDREGVARELGFRGITCNSLDAVGDRDFAVEFVGALALCQVHISRLGEEIVLWMSQEFGFARLSEGYCSGSSIMPQKMNPDLAELVRAKTGRVMGDWVALMTVLKGLPLAYNKDLQETQEPLYDAVETVRPSLRIAAGMVRELEFDAEAMAAAVGAGFLMATELADYLTAKGMPFRSAHDVAGALVRRAAESGRELRQLTLAELRAESELFADDIYSWFDVARAVDRRDLPGAPAERRVREQIARARAELDQAATDQEGHG
jgi:argininosuccinate lyase